MKKLLKILGIAVLALVAVAGGAALYLMNKTPAQRPAPAVTVDRSPERVARGKYLATHVTICVECHSKRIPDRYAYPFAPGPQLVGQVVLTKKQGFPGLLAAPNLTSDRETGLGDWSDGEVMRAMREGVDRKGKALFPMMPYETYRALADADAEAIVAYLRTVPGARNTVPARKLGFPLPLIVPSIPHPLTEPVNAPDPKDPVAYGAYLTAIGGCRFCHSLKNEREQLIPGHDFTGGNEMLTQEGWRVVPPNLTPDADTYIGKAKKEEFIGRFRSFASITAENAPVPQKGRNTIMPWLAFSGMTDDDLGAIYDYLKTLKPVKNKVNPFPDAEETAAPAAGG